MFYAPHRREAHYSIDMEKVDSESVYKRFHVILKDIYIDFVGLPMNGDIVGSLVQ